MKKVTATLLVTVLLVRTAHAAELTLNDLPGILLKLRQCTNEHSMFSSDTTECKIASEDLWAAVDSDSRLTLFAHQPYRGDTIYATGNNVPALLRDFAAKINAERVINDGMLKALAPYLPSN
jgi:hypothetical protein